MRTTTSRNMNKVANLIFLARRWNAILPAVRYAFHEVKRNELCLLANLHGSDKGLGAHGYTRVYEHLFSDMREAVTNMLEIGLLRQAMHAEAGATAFTDAPSLEMWCSYFPKARVIGFDIQDFTGFDHPRCCVVRGDQSSREDLRKVGELLCGSELDIIIDDGSHIAADQQISLSTLFRHLRAGGFYCIEDLNYNTSRPELPNCARTLHVLTDFMKSGIMRSPYLSPEENGRLSMDIGAIALYDSLMARHAGRASLAIVQKR